MRRRSAGIGEVVSSVSMLLVTMAVLGGVSALALTSLRSADTALASGSQEAASRAGVLLGVVAAQTNGTGTYLWLVNYGWVDARLTSVYADGGLVTGWLSTCSPLRAEAICSLRLPPGTKGGVTVFFGVGSVSISI